MGSQSVLSLYSDIPRDISRRPRFAGRVEIGLRTAIIRRRRGPPAPRFAFRASPTSVTGLADAQPRIPFPCVKTYVAKPSDRQRDWLLVDARGKTLGRLATQIADMLRGKRKPEYTPHIDTGDFVVVVNAAQIHVTGDKRAAKLYHRHSGYPGGLRSRTLEQMLERRPEEVIRLAVKGMLPRNRLARQQLRKLKIYAGPDHPHEAQQPRAVEVGT
jgi:large subunit ribosomal protein L13